MKRVLTYGVFDVLDFENVSLLKQAKALGDYLIVALTSDEFNKSNKKETYHTYKERQEMLEACKYVDMVIPKYNSELTMSDIQNQEADIFAIDDNKKGEYDYLKGLCEVVYLTTK